MTLTSPTTTTTEPPAPHGRSEARMVAHGRSEARMVAQALWVMRQTRRVPQDREWLASVCDLLGIDVDIDVGAAAAELGTRPTEKFLPARRDAFAPIDVLPMTLPRGPQQARGQREPRTTGGQRASLPVGRAEPKHRPTSARPARGDELWCRRHGNGQGAWVHKRDFSLRADRPGHYRAWCDDCTSSYGKAKYLSTATLAALHGEGVRVRELPVDCPLVKDPCTVCGEAFKLDDVVVAVDTPIVVHKAGCR